MIAVFCRSDHPEGFGYPNNTAHGYVTVLVRCDDQVQLNEVKERMRDFRWPDRHERDDWFSGRFDLVALIGGHPQFIDDGYGNPTGMPGAKQFATSYGDNRAFAYLDADLLLESRGAS